jgi:hypothetical protein
VLSLADGTTPAFDIDSSRGADIVTRDLGFRRMGIEEVAASVGYQPVVPRFVPPGFELMEVTVAAVPEEGTTTGLERINPPSMGVVALVYRNGLDELVVSSRLADPRPEVDDVWSDPYATSVDVQTLGLARAQARGSTSRWPRAAVPPCMVGPSWATWW